MRRKIMQNISFTLNGDHVEATVKDNCSMLDFLRRDMGLTGTKKGCGEGECGACTIMMNGDPVNACLMLAAEADGQDIVTIEGIKLGATLHPVQQKFIEKWGLQCGFCTPGMIISAVSLLKENPHPTEHEIRDAIAGNLCRCTGYVKIVEAISAAADVLQEEV